MSNLLKDDNLNEDQTFDETEDATNPNFIEKLIYPLSGSLRQPLTIQEIEQLIKADYLAKFTESSDNDK